jgi:hypothetical protein
MSNGKHTQGPWTLFLVFLALRLTGQIDWPWYAVASPIFLQIVILGIVIAEKRRRQK